MENWYPATEPCKAPLSSGAGIYIYPKQQNDNKFRAKAKRPNPTILTALVGDMSPEIADIEGCFRSRTADHHILPSGSTWPTFCDTGSEKKCGGWNLTRPVGNVWNNNFETYGRGYYGYAETYFAKSLIFGFESRFALRPWIGFLARWKSLTDRIPCRESL